MPVDFPSNPRRCSALTRRKGQCRNFAVADTSPPRCSFHGAGTKVVRGIAIPGLRTGRYSVMLPTSLADHYDRVVTDPDLLNMRDQIALVQARMMEVLTDISRNNAAPSWSEARDLWGEFTTAYESGNVAALESSFASIGGLMERASHTSFAWDNIFGMMETLRRLVDTETKRSSTLQATITVERAMVLVGALADVVRRHITDPEQLSKVREEIASAVGMTGNDLARTLPPARISYESAQA